MSCIFLCWQLWGTLQPLWETARWSGWCWTGTVTSEPRRIFIFLSWFLCHVVCVLSQHVGDLGNIIAGPDGRASFRLEDSQLKVTLLLETSAIISSLTQRWPCCRCGTWSADRWSLMPGRTTWVEALTLCQERREILGKGGFGMEVPVGPCTTCA